MVVLAVNGEAVEDRNVSSDRALNPSQKRFYSVLFYLCTFTFVILICLIVLFIVEFEWPKRHILILCIYYE